MNLLLRAYFYAFTLGRVSDWCQESALTKYSEQIPAVRQIPLQSSPLQPLTLTKLVHR